jgi:hypothetical protein
VGTRPGEPSKASVPDELDRLAETLEATHRAARPVTGVEKESATG